MKYPNKFSFCTICHDFYRENRTSNEDYEVELKEFFGYGRMLYYISHFKIWRPGVIPFEKASPLL